MLTFKQVKTSSVANVAGVNVDDPTFAQYVNDAVRQLMDIGGWWGTVQAMVGCIYDGCIVWPRKVDTVVGMKVCHRPVQLENFWYEFVPPDENHLSWARRWGHGHRDQVAEFSGTTPLFWPIDPTNPISIQFSCDNPADFGKSITIYGMDSNRRELFADRPDGTSQRGALLTLGSPYPTTPVPMTYVSAIVKDLTAGNVRAWSYNSATGAILNCVGIYGGGQTSPQFLFSRLHGMRPGVPASLSALVRLGFEEVAQDSDILPLDSLDAIKSMVQAIRQREAGGDGRLHEAEAIRRLNMQLRKRFPMEQFVMSFRPFGNDTLASQKIGSMM
jgi:hypothetical protein